jgi:hypothetical protein
MEKCKGIYYFKPISTDKEIIKELSTITAKSSAAGYARISHCFITSTSSSG